MRLVKSFVPTFAEEEALIAQGYRYIAGVDEVGCGALAGPLVAAAVILPYPFKAPWLKRVRDSKLLTPVIREELSEYIREIAITTGIGMVSHEFVDSKGLTRARRRAMKLAIDQLLPHPQTLLIDYFRIPGVKLPQKSVVNGDSLCFSIACASIIGKVARDRLMVELDDEYPGYGLAQHKGYGTEQHLDFLRRLGPSPIHRMSFQPVRDAAR